MDTEEAKDGQTDKYERQPYRVRLPGFISDEDIGLGDVIKRATSAIGIRPCGSCEQRAAAHDRVRGNGIPGHLHGPAMCGQGRLQVRALPASLLFVVRTGGACLFQLRYFRHPFLLFWAPVTPHNGEW